jgi:hypothetical protein
VVPPVVGGLTVLDFLEFSELAYDYAGGPATLGDGTATVPVPTGWSVLSYPQYVNANGLTAYAFINNTTNQIVISFRGSESDHDWIISDGAIASGNRPAQFTTAEQFYNDLTTAYPAYTILVTGHSLGGAEAEDIAAKFTHPSVI